MTEPIGEVRVEVHADTKNVDPEIEAGLKRASKEVDNDLKDIGDKWGKTTGDAMGKRLEKEGPELARSIQRGVDKERVVTKVVTEYDKDNNVARRWVTEAGQGLERAVRDSMSGSGGGPFGKVGAAVSDAVGAGFNISGKSPLIYALIPLVGFIAQLIVGAVEAASGLVAVLTTIPGLIGAIILQAGVLFIAFQGLGTAIQGAFAAKNADELKKALEGLTPAAQEFVKSLLPLKELFKAFRDVVQEQFFRGFGNSIKVVVDALGPITYANIGRLALALGELGRTLVTFFADPTFVRFFTWLIVYTVKWVDDFSSAIDTFLRGLANLGNAVMPFMDWLGEGLNNAIRNFGQYLSDLSTDPEFLNWLEEMKEALKATGDVLGKFVDSVVSLADAVHKAGGTQTLKDIAEVFGRLATFFQTDIGVKSIEGLIHAATFLSVIFVALVFGVLALLAAFELVLEFLRHGLFPWLADFFTNKIPEFFTMLGDLLMTFFTFVGEIVSNYTKALGQAFLDVGAFILELLFNVAGWVATHVASWLGTIIDFFSGLPHEIWKAVGDLGSTLFNAGKNLIQGLINGALSMLGPLAGAISFLIQKGVKDQTPNSPAKDGPLSGKGDPKFAGQEIVTRLAEGIRMEGPTLASATGDAVSNIVFGPNSVQATFNGALPTNSQAMNLGGALGQGIGAQLATRDTRLAVRAMA